MKPQKEPKGVPHGASKWILKKLKKVPLKRLPKDHLKETLSPTKYHLVHVRQKKVAHKQFVRQLQ